MEGVRMGGEFRVGDEGKVSSMPSACVARGRGASVARVFVAVDAVYFDPVGIEDRERGPRSKATVVWRVVDVVVVFKVGKIVVAVDEVRHVLEVVVGLRRLGRVGELI